VKYGPNPAPTVSAFARPGNPHNRHYNPTPVVAVLPNISYMRYGNSFHRGMRGLRGLGDDGDGGDGGGLPSIQDVTGVAPTESSLEDLNYEGGTFPGYGDTGSADYDGSPSYAELAAAGDVPDCGPGGCTEAQINAYASQYGEGASGCGGGFSGVLCNIGNQLKNWTAGGGSGGGLSVSMPGSGGPGRQTPTSLTGGLSMPMLLLIGVGIILIAKK
jgi:hypothetical protein